MAGQRNVLSKGKWVTIAISISDKGLHNLNIKSLGSRSRYTDEERMLFNKKSTYTEEKKSFGRPVLKKSGSIDPRTKIADLNPCCQIDT